MVTNAIALEDALAMFSGVYNDRITLNLKKVLVLLGGRDNAMQGKVFKLSVCEMFIGSAHNYQNKVNKDAAKIATHESIETDSEIEAIAKVAQSLWKGKGEHVKGAVVRHKETGEYYLYGFLGSSQGEAVYEYEGKPILPENIEGFNEKTRTGAEIALTDGSVHETKVFPTTVKVGNIRSFRINSESYMIIENL